MILPVVALFVSVIAAREVLQPPYFDIAKGKKITATATCGEDFTPPKDAPGELFCSLADVPRKFHGSIKGFSCSYCVPGDYGDGKEESVRDHNIRNANDGSNRWWQSPPLSRGQQYQEVNVTIDLGQAFHVAYVIVKAANSPRPGVWALERSVDGGKTYTPWHYFASNAGECRQYFGVDPYLPIQADDTVLCSTEYSKIPPFKDGEIHISLINGRPGATNFSYSPILQEWTTATNVRLRLLHIKTLLTDLLPLSLEDPTVTRRYYYSIKDISIGGRCMCNGFADECRPTSEVNKFECNCQYNTQGPRCNECKPGFVQKPWRPRTGIDKFECEKCNCHGHSDVCEYNAEVEERKLSLDAKGNYEGGGVCKECKHNTHGINCENCKPFFYRPTGFDITSPNACQPCNCDTTYSTGLCAEETGQCECKEKYTGKKCDQCNRGYYQFPACKKCECDVDGSKEGECLADEIDGCRCKEGYTGKFCDSCKPGFFGYPDCKPCNCSTQYGSVDNNCEQDKGQCRCKTGFSGRQCDKCDIGYYQFPYCKDCGCDPQKTEDGICDAKNGVCKCKENYRGQACQECAAGYYGHPTCFKCDCSTSGSISSTCDRDTGRCECRLNNQGRSIYQGLKCDQCAPGYFGYPNCQPCACNDEGSLSSSCDSSSGQCSCKAIYTGRKCDRCLAGFYGFPECKQCQCNPAGTEADPGGRIGDCSTSNIGQCVCKKHVTGIECTECKPGYYDLQESDQNGCTDCDCHRPGTNNGMTSCTEEGVCNCKAFVGSKKCRECDDGFYGLFEKNMFGCTGCDCDIGGAVSNKCDKTDGKCQCRPNIIGRQCNEVKPEYYFPTLHQIKIELEDGQTEDGDAIRFDYQEKKFPGYSWKGFVFVNDKQPAVAVNVNIPLSSNYIVMFKYSLNQITRATGTISAVNAVNKFSGIVNFPSTQQENGFTVEFTKAEEGSGNLLYFPLTAGEWKFTFKSDDNSNLLLDHMILVPQQYSQASQLTKYAQKPCTVDTNDKLCNLYKYIDLNKEGFVVMEAEKPGRTRLNVPLFNDTAVLSKLDYQAMVLLSPEKQQHNILFNVPKPGRYVAILQYYHDSDEIKYIDVYIRSRVNIQRGKAWLYNCKYTFGCRQTVLDPKSKSEVRFDFKDTKTHMFTLYSRSGATVGVDSVILIPESEWNVDYATPKLYCTTKDGKCTTFDYMYPKDSIKINVEGDEGELRPSFLTNPTVKVKYLKARVNVIDMEDIKAGSYHILLHYYQPNNPGFQTRTGVYTGPRGSGLPGRVEFTTCSNLNGCRTRIQNYNDRPYVLEEGATRLRIDVPEDKNVWVEYILLIPEEFGNDRFKRAFEVTYPGLKDAKPIDLSKEFNEDCSGMFFDVKQDASNFCINSVFSLASIFNDGALSCDCDAQGSTSKYCQEFGGQCPCKPNVIGRQCTRCKVGYYGFPNCRPCNCSTCNEISGQCTCPPGVIGEKCDRCEAGTFGYDPVIGCQPCNCDPIGTGKDNAVCDIVTGQCPCLENYGSRKCSQCAAGYYNYPLCTKCDCFAAGVTGAKCDGKTGDCLCQDNVIGLTCDECPKGFFKTGKGFDALCTKCWCQGRSTECKEAQLYSSVIVMSAEGWTISDDTIPVYKEGNKVQADFTFTSSSTPGAQPTYHYWNAPNDYHGNQAGSYAGKLSYNFEYDLKASTSQPLNSIADVIIKGDGVEIKSSKEFKRNPGFKNLVEIQLHERDWLKSDDSSQITREEMLTVLSKIESLRIRATHDVNIATSTLYQVKMDAAVKDGKDLIFGIEECTCPIEYAGPSCSECAKGFKRQKDGTCGKCECSGKSNECDPETGSCYNCTGNTMGDKCQQCKPGYYGEKCKPCPCPSIDPGKNFADSCGINADSGELVCQCKKGYTGLRCDKCSDGYYGNPTMPGGSCKPCECSGNIDLKLTGNCDAVTGQCYKCLNNSHGNKCDECKPGFFGDAVDKKNCQDCKCDLCGSDVTPCNQQTGQCNCKRNTEGDRCNRCKPNTWNFDACQGCEECNCGAASESQQCDLKTGKCKCKPTVTGRRCDWCELGYYGYTANGCKKCDCPNGGYCDVISGKCDCGILGEDCTLCPPGHIIENGKCVECDSCVQNILKRVNVLLHNYTNIKNNIIPPGVLNNASLEAVNKTLMRLTKDTDVFEVDLEVLRKAIGFGDYGGYEGDQSFYTVETFRDCDFESNQPIQTVAPTTTIQSPTTTEPTATTESTIEPNTATITSSTSEPSTTDMSTTTEFIIGPLGETTGAPVINSESKRKRRRRQAGSCPASLSKIFEKTNNQFSDGEKKIVKLDQDARSSAGNATATKVRAQELLDSIKKFIRELEETLKLANSSTGTGPGNVNSGASLKEAREILAELRNRSFTVTESNAQREKESSKNASAIANKLKEQANEIEERASKFKNTFKDLLESFKNVRKESGTSKEKSEKGKDLLDMVKKIDWKSLVELAKKINATNQMTLDEAMDILMSSQTALSSAESAYKQFNNQTGPLAELMEELRAFIRNITAELSTARPIVDRSLKHAEDLRKLADELSAVLDDTKEYAKTALEAARVYSTIVDAIEQALAAARLANTTSHEANGKADIVKGSALASKSRSNSVNEEANALENEVIATLRVSMKGVDMRSDELKDLRKRIEGRIYKVKDDLVTFEREKEVGEKAVEVSKRADEAKKVAEDGENLAKKLNDDIKGDEVAVANLKRNITDLNDLLEKVKQNITKVEDKIPELNATVQVVKRKYEEIEETIKNNVANSIEYIKYLIANSRSILDHLKLSMRFNETSSLVLDAPRAAYDPSINNEMSMFFSIDEGVKDGFLLFIGNGESPDSNDYLALEIVNNKVRFHYKLSSGEAQNVTVDKEIVTGIQYKFFVTRLFGNAKVKIIEFGESGKEDQTKTVITEHTANIPSPILNLGSNSDLFIGGVPEGRNIPSVMAKRTFKGCMESLMYNAQKMGLWNWKSAKAVGGCERKPLALDPDAYTLSGDRSNIQLNIRIPSDYGLGRIDLEFATRGSNGLIFLGMDPPTQFPDSRRFAFDESPVNFYALQLEDGYLVSLFDFGVGYMKVKHESFGRINDGKVHNVTMRAKPRFIRVWIDTDKDGPRAADIGLTGYPKFKVSKAFAGGLPMRAYSPHPDISRESFAGAVRNIQIKDCTACGKAKSGYNYKFGFEIPFGNSASFPSKRSHMTVPACSITSQNPFGVSFQTYMKDGVLVAADGPMDTELVISLKDEQVNVVLTQANIETDLISTISGGLSDGTWHTLTLTIEDGDKISLYLGADNRLVKNSKPLPESFIKLDGNMILGGLADQNVGFNGNIRQVYMCGSKMDLFKGDGFHGAKIGTNLLHAPIQAALPPTTPPPTTATTTVTTTTVSTTTTSPPTTTTTTTTTTKSTTESITTQQPTTVLTTTEDQQVSTNSPSTTEEKIVGPIEVSTASTTTVDKTTETSTTQEMVSTPEAATTTPRVDSTTKKFDSTTEESDVTTTGPVTTSSTTTTTTLTTYEPITTKEPTTTTPEPVSTTLEPVTTTFEPTTTTPEPATTIPEPTTTTSTTTTTTMTTTTTTSAPITTAAPTCSSKLKPADLAYGFGMDANSYIEFGVMKGKLDQKSQFEFSFYTMEPDGILLSANMKSVYDYESVFLSDGKVNYIFNAGSGPLVLTSKKTYNDGKWHKVLVRRSKIDGYLSIDNVLVQNGKSKPGSSAVNHIEKIYFGGVPSGAKVPSQFGKIRSLKGGMKGFKSFDIAMVTPAVKQGTTEAYSDGLPLGNAISVGTNGGYVQKYKKLRVGQKFSISFDVRSRKASGTLFHVQGGGDYLTITIEKDGSIQVVCNNGGGRFSVSYKPKASICNGDFYSVLLEKNQKTLKLSVNGVLTEETTTKSSSSADTNSPAYFGGLPVNLQPKGYKLFSGCISKVQINGNSVGFENDAIKSGYVMSGCAEA